MSDNSADDPPVAENLDNKSRTQTEYEQTHQPIDVDGLYLANLGCAGCFDMAGCGCFSGMLLLIGIISSAIAVAAAGNS